MRRSILSTLVTVVLLVLLAPAAAQALTFDQAIDQLIAQGYPQKIEADLNSFGTSALGMRMGGTTADNAAAEYIAVEMKRLGMTNVRLEKVPVDVWTWRGASVQAGGRVMTATSFGGVPGTPFGGLTGDLVYAGLGSVADLSAAGVAGKVVLLDSAYDTWWWFNLPGLEAKLAGAKAVVMTFNPLYNDYYAIAPDALGTNDGCYDWDACPMVYVCQNDGDWLKSMLRNGEVKATVTNDVTMRFADKGGYGLNVYGEVAGSDRSGQVVMYGSHHDAYFRMGLDDTSGVVANLMMVKAMKMSGYKPSRSIALLETTSEEWGYTNSYYDWLAGSYQAAKMHTEWPGKVVAFVENELLGYKDGHLWMSSTPELKPFLEQTVAANRQLTRPGDGRVFNPGETVWFTYNDQWPMTARGIPSVCLWTPPENFWWKIYHSTYENTDLVDWTYLGDNTKLIWRIAQVLDKGLLPYSPKARADDLASTVDGAALKDAGCDPAVVDRVTSAVAAFQAASDAYEVRKTAIPTKRVGAVNTSLLGIEIELNRALTGLGAWDETYYPHQQALMDAQHLNQTIALLDNPNPVPSKVQATLYSVGITGYGVYFSPAVWQRELARRQPGYYRLNWAEWGQPRFIDVMDEYRMIGARQFEPARAGLVAIRDAQVADLNARLTAMSQTLESVTPGIQALE